MNAPGAGHVVIIANGLLSDPERARAVAQQADLLLCADGGTHHALAWGLLPDTVIGDMDSLQPGELERLEKAGVALITYPARKDATDLELALDHAVRVGARDITVVAAFGGRLDQSFANAFLLAWDRLEGVFVEMVNGRDRLFLARGEARIRGRPGDLVSLLPLSPVVTRISTQGLDFPLRDETLHMGRTRGVSNVMVSAEARITFDEGLLFVVHRDQSPSP